MREHINRHRAKKNRATYISNLDKNITNSTVKITICIFLFTMNLVKTKITTTPKTTVPSTYNKQIPINVLFLKSKTSNPTKQAAY